VRYLAAKVATIGEEKFTAIESGFISSGQAFILAKKKLPHGSSGSSVQCLIIVT